MIDQNAFNTITTAARSLWNAIGPLAYVAVGAYLTRSWDKKKWMNDNRKEECRELITAITAAASALLERSAEIESRTITGATNDRATSLYNDSLRVLNDRIFIAKDIDAANLLHRWGPAIAMAMPGKTQQFMEEFNSITATIRQIAMRGL
jgi:hypothetical protein